MNKLMASVAEAYEITDVVGFFMHGRTGIVHSPFNDMVDDKSRAKARKNTTTGAARVLISGTNGAFDPSPFLGQVECISLRGRDYSSAGAHHSIGIVTGPRTETFPPTNFIRLPWNEFPALWTGDINRWELCWNVRSWATTFRGPVTRSGAVFASCFSWLERITALWTNLRRDIPPGVGGKNVTACETACLTSPEVTSPFAVMTEKDPSAHYTTTSFVRWGRGNCPHGAIIQREQIQRNLSARWSACHG